MKEFIVQIDETKVPEEFIHQLEKHHKELIRCKDCKWGDTWVCSESKSDSWFCPKGKRRE